MSDHFPLHNPAKFPPPQQWVSVMPSRTTPRKTHNTLGNVRASVSGATDLYWLKQCADQSEVRVRVYQWDADTEVWVERYVVTVADIIADPRTHPFYTDGTRQPKAPKPISEKVLAATIRSIQRDAPLP